VAKIDWNRGQGRRGRPLRRVLGMGQQQGLMVMYGIAAVAVLFAVAAALGSFDDSSAKPVGSVADGSGTNPDGAASGSGAPVPKDSSKATQLLLGSVRHYADLLAAGQKIVGHTHYSDMSAYGEAFADSKSPAAAFAKFRVVPNPEADISYLDAERQAAAAYDGDHGGTLNQWLNDMAKVKTDLAQWVATAARYQQGSATQATLDTAATTVTQDLAKATADAESLSK
jgi:hypothetical protein